jgi:hypothetical protein
LTLLMFWPVMLIPELLRLQRSGAHRQAVEKTRHLGSLSPGVDRACAVAGCRIFAAAVSGTASLRVEGDADDIEECAPQGTAPIQRLPCGAYFEPQRVAVHVGQRARQQGEATHRQLEAVLSVEQTIEVCLAQRLMRSGRARDAVRRSPP